MITLVEGMIGAGKTYFVVSEILKSYYTFSESELKWIPKQDMDVAIYSNIDGFTIANDLTAEIEKAGGVNPFFTVKYQMKFAHDRRHVYAIDEAQKMELFHRKFYDPEVFYFFQYHRHLGVDLYLITQDVGSLARELQTLNEYHIKAVRRSYALLKEFRYNYMVGREVFRRKVMKKDLRVFLVFRSSNQVGAQKVKSFATRYYFYVIFLMSFTVFGFIYFVKSFGNRASKLETASAKVVEKRYKVVAVSSGNVYLRGQGKMMKVSSKEVSGELKPGELVSLNSEKMGEKK